MFIEFVEPRLLMTARGLDPGFATHGRFTFGNGRATGDAIVSTGTVTFVEVTKASAHSVAKIDANGKLDTAFGTNGFAAVPQDVDHLAYDADRGLLYATGTVASSGDSRISPLHVTRLLPTGRVDTGFADAGTFSYAQPLPAPQNSGDDPVAQAHVEQINLLPDGSAVLAVDRSVTLSGYFESTTEGSLALFKLRSDGTRDPNFGRRGATEIFSGTSVTRYPAGGLDQTVSVNRPYFADVRTDAAGVSRVLLLRVTGTGSSGFDDFPPEAADAVGPLQIKARTVSARGAIDEATADSWTLRATSTATVAFAGFDGGTVKLVLRTPGLPAANLYTLRPGQKPKTRPLAFAGLKSVGRFARDAGGDYFVADSIHVTRLASDFTVDKAFGLHGVATADRPFNGLFADESGRVLATDGEGLLERLV